MKINVGDTVWIHGTGTKDNALHPAKVEHIFNLWGYEHYVVSVATPIEPVLYVRDKLSISDDPKKSIFLWRRPSKIV